jgi:sodium pump decarboxylase gamma subunit
MVIKLSFPLTIKLILEVNFMNLAAFNPYYSFEDAMGVVVTGLAVVFLVLIVLVVAFYIMGAFFAPKKVKEETPAPKKPEAPKPVAAPKKPANSNLAVVAAITAALNEYLGAGNFIIKKILHRYFFGLNYKTILQCYFQNHFINYL